MDTIKLVFDAKSWNGKDIGDNECFWKPAVIIRKYFDKEGRELADVVFLEDNQRTSYGHFIEYMKPYHSRGK